jgi:phenylalanine-4-hydroxylase
LGHVFAVFGYFVYKEFVRVPTGAGLLSSIAELRHSLSDEAKPKIKPFDPEVTAREECIITSFQNAYYYSESFEEAKERMRFNNISHTSCKHTD